MKKALNSINSIKRKKTNTNNRKNLKLNTLKKETKQKELIEDVDYKTCINSFNEIVFNNKVFDGRTNEYNHTFSLSKNQKQDLINYYKEQIKNIFNEDIDIKFDTMDLEKDKFFLYKDFFFSLKGFDTYLKDYILKQINKYNTYLNKNKKELNFYDYTYNKFDYLLFKNINNQFKKCELEFNFEVNKDDDVKRYNVNKFVVKVNYLNF